MIRVAAYQATPTYSETERVQQVVEALKRADDEQINFLCFPEGFLTGYYAEKELAEKTSMKVASDDFQDFLIKLLPLTSLSLLGSSMIGRCIYNPNPHFPIFLLIASKSSGNVSL